MPVTNVWDNEEKTIIRMEVIGHWTWGEMYQGAEEGYAMLESVDHMVHAIIDFSQSASIPGNALTHGRNLMRQQHHRLDITVFVGVSPMFLSLWRVFTHVHAVLMKEQDFTFAQSLDEARAFLAQAMAKRKVPVSRRPQPSSSFPIQE